MTDPLDVLTMGRVSVDVYPDQPGPIEDVETFRTYLGGSPTNVAVAAARYGRRAATITAVGDDPFGRLVRRELVRYGLDDRFLVEHPGLRTPLAFCEMFPPETRGDSSEPQLGDASGPERHLSRDAAGPEPLLRDAAGPEGHLSRDASKPTEGRFPIYFYRDNAPDLTITPDELDLAAVRAARVFWATVTGLSAEPSRSATLAALRARDRAPYTVLDLDYRPSLWRSREEARPRVREAIGYADVVVGNLDEYDTAVGRREPEPAAQAVRALGARLAVVKRGSDGVLGYDATGPVAVAAVRVAVVNGLGAGDGFGGALCHGLLAGWPLARILRFANAAGALVTTQIACSAAMPTAAQVEALLAQQTGAHRPGEALRKQPGEPPRDRYGEPLRDQQREPPRDQPGQAPHVGQHEPLRDQPGQAPHERQREPLRDRPGEVADGS